MAKKLTDEIVATKGKYIIAFMYPSCDQCGVVKKQMDALEEEGYPVYEVDIQTMAEYTGEFKVANVPTVLIVENRKTIERINGVKHKVVYKKAFNKQ